MMDKSELTFKVVFSKVFKNLKQYYFVILVYTFALGFLSLATPISVQSLVNTYSLSTEVSPLVNISIILFVLLVFFAFLKSMQYIVVELLQQKLFAQLSVEVARKVLLGSGLQFQNNNIRERVNRFFEIVTIQKLASLFFTDGLTIIIQTFIGVILLSLYHPFFIVFNLFFLILIVFIFYIYINKSKVTAIDESTAKFKLAGFLQEAASAEGRIQSYKITSKLLEYSDRLILSYLKSRKAHFKVVFIQSVFFLGFYAFVNSVLLGLGGYLIIKEQLTVGQLVAAEIIVNSISIYLVYSLKHLQSLYDMYASCSKLAWLLDLEEIRFDQNFTQLDISEDNTFEIQNLSIEQENKKIDFSSKLTSNHIYTFKYKDSVVKEKLINILLKNIDPSNSNLILNSSSFKDLTSLEVKNYIYCIDEPIIFDGSIRFNLFDFDTEVKNSEIYKKLEDFDLNTVVDSFKNKLDQKIFSGSDLLSYSQKYKLTMARVLMHQPLVLIVKSGSELFSKNKFYKYLKNFLDTGCIVINFVHDESIEDLFEMSIDHEVNKSE